MDHTHLADARRRRRQLNPTPLPQDRSTPAGRGQALRHWLDRHGLAVRGFAGEAGLAESTLNTWMNGHDSTWGVDLAGARPSHVRLLVEAMRRYEELSDDDIAELFDLPEDVRGVWATGDLVYGQAYRVYTMSQGVTGTVGVPAGWVVRVRPVETERGMQLVSLGEGRFTIAPAGIIAREYQRLGRVVDIGDPEAVRERSVPPS